MKDSRLFLALAATGVFLFASELHAQAVPASVAPEAEQTYRQGVAAENAGDMKTAVEKYLASAKIGNAAADEKLGQLYDKGVGKTLPRDLQESIGHYQSARERGREIKKPIDRSPNPGNVK